MAVTVSVAVCDVELNAVVGSAYNGIYVYAAFVNFVLTD